MGWARRAAAAIALGLMVVYGVHAAASSNRVLRSIDRANPTLPKAGNYFAPAHFGALQNDFLDFVRRTLPEGASFRLIQPALPYGPHDLPPAVGSTNGVCGAGPTATYTAYVWITYALLPRASTCSADNVWSVYFGIAPSVPAGSQLYTFRPGYAVVGP